MSAPKQSPNNAPPNEATQYTALPVAANHNHAPKDKHARFAEDLVYTINHAIVCGASDIIDPFIGAYTQKYLGQKLVFNPLHDWAHEKFEHHDHAHHDHGHHDHHAGCGHGHDNHSFGKNLTHWVIGEAVGDIGAVPLTLAMQHYTPGIMRGIQNVTEPLLSKPFHWSADRYSRKWAYENGFDANSPEARARAQELYTHEVDHLPHAFVWTGSAAGLNILTQKAIGSKGATSHLIAGKALGSIGTLGLVLLFRSLAPGKVQQLDDWNTKNIAEPLTRRISGWFGVDSATVDRVFDREREREDGHRIIEKTVAEKSSDKAADEGRKPAAKIHSAEAKLLTPTSFARIIG